jgi:hypothetical protein
MGETDRELLELAAKAAGMIHMKWTGSGMVRMIDPTRPAETGSIGSDWNPLTDDGDALRLAVKLQLCLGPNLDGTHVVCQYGLEGKAVLASLGDDPYAATRRVIVGAAAEIAKEQE